MKYSFTNTAFVGTILAATGSASPITQISPTGAVSTPSFSPDYSSVVGTFTAVAAGSPTTTPVSTGTFDFYNLGLGPTIPGTPTPGVLTSLSTSTVETPTKTSITGPTTPSSLFPGFHPHFGHGPVVPGRGFNSSHKSSNSTKPQLRDSRHQPSNSTVLEPTYSSLDGTTHRQAPKPSLSQQGGEGRKSYCKSHYWTFMCEKWVRVDRWWHGERFPHTKHAPHAHHNKSLKSHKDRSIDMSPQPSVEATTTPAPTPTITSTRVSTPAKTFSSATPMPIDLRADQRQVDYKIHDAKLKIKFYKEEVARANKELMMLRKQGNEDAAAMGPVVYNAQVVGTYQMEQLKNAKEEKARLEKERKQIRKQLSKEQHFWE